MAAPLTARDVVVGILFLGRTGAHRFHASDFETFKLFAGLSASAIHRAMLIERNRSIYRASVEVLAAVVDAHDPSTLRHSRNVAYYARACAEMLGLEAESAEQVELAGLLHDIGKLALPNDLLESVDGVELTAEGPNRDHPEHGATILSQHPALTWLAPLVRHHHEHYDGSGFPDQLSADRIPVGARIIGIVDAFELSVASQPAPERNAIEAALDVLEAGVGTRFDPEITETFVRGIRAGRIDPAAPDGATVADDAIQAIADIDRGGAEEYRTG